MLQIFTLFLFVLIAIILFSLFYFENLIIVIFLFSLKPVIKNEYCIIIQPFCLILLITIVFNVFTYNLQANKKQLLFSLRIKFGI